MSLYVSPSRRTFCLWIPTLANIQCEMIIGCPMLAMSYGAFEQRKSFERKLPAMVFQRYLRASQLQREIEVGATECRQWTVIAGKTKFGFFAA